MHKAVKMWSIYIMAAPAMKGLTYFKVGITSDIAKRVCAVQTGCPLRISRVWVILAGGNGHAQAVESAMHANLSAFHSHGEWFAMETANPDHKRAMSEAMVLGAEMASGKPGVKWREMDVPDLKAAVRDAAAEDAEFRRSRVREQSKRAIVQMAIRGRQIM